MDTDNPNQRAASQSSIRSANTRQGHIRHSNTFQGFSRPGSQRPPLRAVDNNATLLRAPGPLESMLKTTTETGDIGFFTIGASASSDTYHQPQRLGPSLQDVPLARSARSRRQHQQNYFQDDRLQLPSSYRDTTSEILSLYGSEAHQSRTFTPSNEDVQRSYSLTTCSSRHIPSHKSSATLQSLSSTSGVQRPRSPFPYPTRLKRPGTRPASPAVTDNGTIDYNRALELDRSHQRTPYGGYRPAPTYHSQRAPPLSVRSESNRSTTSLPSRSSPGPYPMSPSPYRVRTPSSYRTRTPRPSNRSRRDSNDHGLRSPSLTSIVEMYQRPVTANLHGGLSPPTGSFYYDYSEEFENSPSPFVEPENPLCPIPQRAPSLSRPMVLRAEEKEALDDLGSRRASEKHANSITPILEEGQGDESAAVTEQPTQAMGDPALTHDQDQDPMSSEPVILREDTEVDLVRSSDDASEGQYQATVYASFREPTYQTRATNSDGEQSKCGDTNESEIAGESHGRTRLSSFDAAALGTSMISPGKRCRRSKTMSARVDNIAHATTEKHHSQSSLGKLKSTLDANLFEFASLLTSFDRLAKSPFSRKGEDGVVHEEIESLIGRQSQSQDDDSPPNSRPGPVEGTSSQQSSETTEESGRPFHKRHRRNIAATHISTTGIKRPDQRVGSQRCKPFLEIVLPGSVSPTRQLKVKRSTPQLMKALPPLPAEAEIHDSRANSSGYRTKSVESTSGKLGNADGDHSYAESQLEASPPKLKLRVKPLPTTPIPSNDTFDKPLSVNQPTSEDTGSPAPRKLRIKISRNHVVPTHTGKDGTVLRSPALKQCNSLADLEHCARKDIFTSQCRLQNAFSEPMIESKVNETTELSKHLARISPSNVTRRGLVGTEDTSQLLSSSNRPGLRRARSMGMESKQGEPHGLRQKLSFLRLRLGVTQGGRGPKQEEALLPFGIRDTGSSPAEIDLKSLGPKVGDVRPGKAQRRVHRWAKGAKNAMRRAMRKTLDRSANMTA